MSYWEIGFAHDTGGGTIRVLSVLDVYSRECVALRAGKGFRGVEVAAVLTAAGQARARLLERISVDNGTEFTSRALDHWAYWTIGPTAV